MEASGYQHLERQYTGRNILFQGKETVLNKKKQRVNSPDMLSSAIEDESTIDKVNRIWLQKHL